ncbi:HAMP domain-containing sensor histidine kinase [Streptomyces aurantiacus]|uniref:histidine kinase n=1 Tax=Streptomyces aurantiacus JA 4570 TaxID=1286094 RepID=S4AV08_9ACTN|nr:HAMP domain-containing sensor histidine kinase [Streptomyces aurantiacus]EPH45282.1 putative sensor histidine kinase TcrY [Streptomyces aurantiacus JA 4570]
MRLRGPGRRGRLGTNSLRAKLTLVNVALLALGIVAATAVSLMGMRHYLLDNVNSGLTGSRTAMQQSGITLDQLQYLTGLSSLDGLVPSSAKAKGLPPPESTFVVFDRDGKLAELGPLPPTARQRALATATGDPLKFARSGSMREVTLGGDAYRAIGAELDDGSVMVMAASTENVQSGIARALKLDLAFGAVLLGLLAVLTMIAAHQRLRPLEDMVETASAIADGDLKRRVPAHPGAVMETEQLRLALNSMLQQVETAFATRERSEAQLRQFVADASHELRTPLSAIRGYLQLYDKGMLTDPEDRTRAWDRVNSETDRMNHLVAELLTLARLDQQPELRFRSVDLGRVVRDAADDLRAQEPDRPLTVRADGSVLVQADEQGLRKVLANLLANVRTHTTVDTPVRLGLDRCDGVVHLTVADQGPGMAAADAARVFDRFFRAGRGAGSGLGMAIVQGVVASHGGEVAVRTAPGKGLTVLVTLPRTPAPPRPAAPPRPTEPPLTRAVTPVPRP